MRHLLRGLPTERFDINASLDPTNARYEVDGTGAVTTELINHRTIRFTFYVTAGYSRIVHIDRYGLNWPELKRWLLSQYHY